jgi:patatin-like phospholipase/acyl hydrolase
MATSAAPTFFEPYKIKNNTFVDGGLCANNPA